MNNPQTTAYHMELMSAQAGDSMILQNGKRQDDHELNVQAEHECLKQISMARIHGDQQLEEIFRGALKQIRRRYL